MAWICKHPLISLSPPNFGEKIECEQENRDVDEFCEFCGYHKEIKGLNRADSIERKNEILMEHYKMERI